MLTFTLTSSWKYNLDHGHLVKTSNSSATILVGCIVLYTIFTCNKYTIDGPSSIRPFINVSQKFGEVLRTSPSYYGKPRPVELWMNLQELDWFHLMIRLEMNVCLIGLTDVRNLIVRIWPEG